MTGLRAAALAPFPLTIEDGKGAAQWPGIPRYLLAWRYWHERDVREAIRCAASGVEADAIAAAHDPSYAGNETERPAGGPPHVYWPAIEPMLWRRAVHERAMQDDSFRDMLLSAGIAPGADLLTAAMIETRARFRLADAATLAGWMLPPRFALPWIAQGSIGWRMGGGEDYLYKHRDWEQALPADEAALYAAAYPETVR